LASFSSGKSAHWPVKSVTGLAICLSPYQKKSQSFPENVGYQ